MSGEAPESAGGQPSAGEPAHVPDQPVFISYASQDVAIADAIVEALERHGLKCWIAPRDVKAGALYAEAIVRAISGAKALVVVLSENSIVSPHVGKEVERASSKRRPIIAFRIDETPPSPALEYFLSESQWVDARARGIAAALAKLIAAIGDGSHNATAISPSPMSGTSAAKPAAATPWLQRNRHLLASTFIAVVVATGVWLLADKFRTSEHIAQEQRVANASPAAAATVPASSAISEKSVAVLPFINMSEDKNNEYFSDGLSEELIDMLTKVPDLQVAARTSSFYFKGKQVTVSEIAKALGVSHVLEGSVRKSGNKLRITAQLIRVDNGYHVWSQTYDRELHDIFKVQDEIADAVVRALKASLLQNTTDTGLGAQNPDAYALYLQGRSIATKANTKEEYELAADYFQRSLKIDPTFADAWAALGNIRATETAWGFLDPQAGYGEARRLADKALALNPRLSKGHAVLGRINELFEWNWAEALAEFQKAYDLDPNNAGRSAALGFADMLFRGDAEEALRLIKKAIKLDPVAVINYAFLGEVFYYSGRLTDAASAYRKVLDLDPNGYGNHLALGRVLLVQGKAEMALEEFQRERFPHGRRTGIALAYVALGRKAEADSALADLERLDGALGAYEVAQVYAYREQIDQAFVWLERAFRQRDNSLIDVHLDPLLKNLRSDPRYKAFVRKMNLPE
jgi:TolB-like protein/Flp pilus assembly protein TadD